MPCPGISLLTTFSLASILDSAVARPKMISSLIRARVPCASHLNAVHNNDTFHIKHYLIWTLRIFRIISCFMQIPYSVVLYLH